MTDTKFIEILDVLKEIHLEFTDLRCGQVIQDAIDNAKKNHNEDLHNHSSKSLLKSLREFQNQTRIKRDKHGS